MINIVDERLLREIESHRLVFTCERCAQFEADSQSCSAGYPNHDHRARPLQVGSRLVFCKEFELA